MIARIIFALRVMFRAIVAISLCIMPLSASQAQSDDDLAQKPRLALVIGNSSYENLPALKNPGQDAALVATTLRNLGFEVVEESDLTRKGFEAAVRDAARKADDYEAVLFYYAGHGFQLDGRNYLVPVDAKLTNRKRIGEETLVLDDIIGKLHDDSRQTLFFLDACRNNPIPVSAKGEKLSEGLAQVETGRGTFVAFATQPGNITNDGAGEHSPFTLALAKHMETGGISISDMMIRVRNSVEEQTLEKQTPWDQSSLRSQFYFKPVIENSESLTEDDLGLLTQLDPALLEKFQKRFGLDLSKAEGDTPAPVIANVRPTLRIEEADPDQPADDSEVEAASLQAQPPALARSASEPAQVEAGLLILDGDEEGDAPVDIPGSGLPEAAIAMTALPKIAIPTPKPVLPPEPQDVAVKQEPPAAIAQKAPAIVPAPKAKAEPEVLVTAKLSETQPILPAPAAKAPALKAPPLLAPAQAKDLPKPAPATGAAVNDAAQLPKPAAPKTPPVIAPVKSLPTDAPKPAEQAKTPAAAAPEQKKPDKGSIEFIALAKPEAPKFPVPEIRASDAPSAKASRAEPVLPVPAKRIELPAPIKPANVPPVMQAAQPPAKTSQPIAAQAPAAAPAPAKLEPKPVIAVALPKDLKPVTNPADIAKAPEPAAQTDKPVSTQLALAPKLTPTSRQESSDKALQAPVLPQKTAASSTPAPTSVPAPKNMFGMTATPATPAADGQNKADKEIQMAALDPNKPPEKVLEAPKVEAPAIPEAAITDQKPSAEKQKEFAIRAQKELQRLGCFRSAIDGNWSTRSARALLRYYAERKINPDEVEPSQKLIDLLSSEQTVVCKTTKSEKPKQTVQKQNQSKTKASSPPKNSGAKAQPAPNVAKPKPAAPTSKKTKPVETTRTAPKPPVGKPKVAPITGLFR